MIGGIKKDGRIIEDTNKKKRKFSFYLFSFLSLSFSGVSQNWRSKNPEYFFSKHKNRSKRAYNSLVRSISKKIRRDRRILTDFKESTYGLGSRNGETGT